MDYWTECIESSFEEAGIVATKEQIQMVAGDVEISSENYDMYSGNAAIPNPRDADIEQLNRRIKEVEAERDKADMNFRKNVARRCNCDVSDVHIEDNGHATIY